MSCWQSAYTGIVDPAYPVRLSVEKFTGIFKSIILESKQTVFVYEVNEDVIGFISGVLNSGEYDAEVKGLYVEPGNQGIGVGKKLLDYMKEFFVSMGSKTMVIWTLLGAKNNAFYISNGGVAKNRKLLKVGDKQYEGIGFSYKLTSNKILKK